MLWSVCPNHTTWKSYNGDGKILSYFYTHCSVDDDEDTYISFTDTYNKYMKTPCETSVTQDPTGANRMPFDTLLFSNENEPPHISFLYEKFKPYFFEIFLIWKILLKYSFMPSKLFLDCNS